jgi:hypothetical protein
MKQDVCSELLVNLIMAVVATDRHLTLVLNTVISPSDTSEFHFTYVSRQDKERRL